MLFRSYEALQVSCNCLGKSQIEGVANQRVPDADFVCPGNLLVEVRQVLQAEVVSGVESQSCFAASLGRFDIGLDALLKPSLLAGFGVGGGVEFDPVGAGLLGALHHPHVGGNEKRGADAFFVEHLYDIGQESALLHGVPSVV